MGYHDITVLFFSQYEKPVKWKQTQTTRNNNPLMDEDVLCRCFHFRGVGIEYYTEVSPFQGVEIERFHCKGVGIEVSPFQGVGIERFYCYTEMSPSE